MVILKDIGLKDNDMDWNHGDKPKKEGLYLIRTTSGLGGLEVCYKTAYWCGSRWHIEHGEKVTNYVVIDEPLAPTGIYSDPLKRIDNVAAQELGVDLYGLGPA